MSKYRELRRVTIGEMLDDLFFSPMIYFPETTSWTLRGRWVDDSKYDIVPKESYKQELTRQKQEEIDSLEDYYQKRRKVLIEERDRLLGIDKPK